MAAVMDLDLNCSPPSPDPAANDDLSRSMLRQDHNFHRDQVKGLRRLYWTHDNLKVPDDVPLPPLWNHSSDALLYARHPSPMVDLNNTQNPDGFTHCHDLGSQDPRFVVDGVSWENFQSSGSLPRKPDYCCVQGRSPYKCVIDLEKPASLDGDDVDIVSSPAFTNYASHNGGRSDHSQCVPLDSSSVTHAHLSRGQKTPYVTSGSIGSSDTPDSHSPAREKNAVSGHMCIDLNVAQEDDLNFCPDPSKLVCYTSTSPSTRPQVVFCNKSSKTFLKGRESSMGSSKGSSITVATTIAAPDSSREEVDAGMFCDIQSHRPFCVETSNPLPRKDIHHQHVRHMISGLDSQGRTEVPQKAFSVCSNGGDNSYSGLAKLGDSQASNLMVQAAAEAVAVISDDEMGGIDLNIEAESSNFTANFASNYLRKPVTNDGRYCLAQNEDLQNIPSIECPSIRNQNVADKSMYVEDVQSPVSGIAINRSVLIPETPQGCDNACPQLRSSDGASVAPEVVSVQETEIGEDEKSAAVAAETLVSIFTSSSVWLPDSHGSNSETDTEDVRHEPAPSLNSFEESILSLEEMEDDGKSFPARAPEKDGPLCGIKLKRGRGLRDFQREILPGLVSLARHEICDDLHAIGYEIRKTRSRRSPGDECSPPTRMRLPRRCSTAWNR